MNEEVTQLKKRIAELERMNAELVRENAALKGKPQKETRQKRDQATEILNSFFESSQPLTASQVAARFNLSQSAAQYHLDHLVANGFLTLSGSYKEARSGGNSIGYAITPLGRTVITGG
jgi:Fic family protein